MCLLPVAIWLLFQFGLWIEVLAHYPKCGHLCSNPFEIFVITIYPPITYCFCLLHLFLRKQFILYKNAYRFSLGPNLNKNCFFIIQKFEHKSKTFLIKFIKNKIMFLINLKISFCWSGWILNVVPAPICSAIILGDAPKVYRH